MTNVSAQITSRPSSISHSSTTRIEHVGQPVELRLAAGTRQSQWRVRRCRLEIGPDPIEQRPCTMILEQARRLLERAPATLPEPHFLPLRLFFEDLHQKDND